MIGWARNRLAVRQASYAIMAIIAVAFVASIIGVTQLYYDERRRVTETITQQSELIASAAARAAYHVDDIQAKIILEGLFRSGKVQWARISTNLNETLAEKQRLTSPSFTDPLTQALFGRIAAANRKLGAWEFDQTGDNGIPKSRENQHVGQLELRYSADIIGREFLNGIIPFVAGLIFQFVLLGVTLVVIFHRTLTMPLLSYAEAISRFGTGEMDQPLLAVPKGHEHNEFGTVVAQTNRLLERIKTQQENLVHREKIAALGTLLAGVSHELNNPLAILVAQSELLIETTHDEEAKKRGEKIHSMANRCATIVRRFLALSRQRDVDLKSQNVVQIISEVLEILDFQLEQAGVSIAVDVSANLPPIRADFDQITQVLLNLIINAQHALEDQPDNKQISIKADCNEQTDIVRITVSDNGPGVEIAKRERIFEPFYTTKSEGQGTGLGLSYAYKVALNHHGNLTFTTNQVGGAEFTLTLPAINTRGVGEV